jgi:endonuclease III
MAGNLEIALTTFADAEAYVERAGLMSEVEWQSNRRFSDFTETDLLREAAWVILCTCFREEIVRQVFDHVSLSFCDWESSEAIIASAPVCRHTALASFRNGRKLDAIVLIARQIHEAGFESLKSRIIKDPVRELSALPYIGPVTAWHLAKNLGFDAAKPDRHLVRLCNRLGFVDAHELCGAVAAVTGRTVAVVDIVLWRYLSDVRPLGTTRKSKLIRSK